MKQAIRLLCLCTLPAWSQTAPKLYMTEPHLAPDRNELAFVSGGDIWRVSSNGGEASLLVSHPADDSRPLYSPDGTQLAFVSTRTGEGDIYLLTLATGELRRLTFAGGREQLDAWSRDGKWLYFHSTAQDIAGMNDVFRVRASGGTPTAVAADRYANEFFAAPSPDGSTVAINARGIAARQWWRKGHSHLDMSEIWFVKPGPVYERVTDGAAKEIWPMWMPDGRSLFFVSDRTGDENLWRQPVGGTSRQVTQFKDGRVLWPTISYDGKSIFFERDFGIWKMDTNSGKAGPLAIRLRGVALGPETTHITLNKGFEELTLSPDGKKIAFAVHGEIFAAAANNAAGEAVNVSRTHAHETQPVWSPESSKLAYVSNRNGTYHLYLYDFVTRVETQLTSSSESDASPHFSPDGKSIAFFRSGATLWVFDLETKQERRLAEAEVGRHPLAAPKAIAWSPDSKFIAFAARNAKSFTNILVVSLESGKVQPVSFLANSFTRSVVWSADGKFLLFDTSQRTEQRRIARVDLVPVRPEATANRLQDLFGPRPEAAKTGTVEIVWEGLRSRLTLLNLGVDVEDFSLAPDAVTLLIQARNATHSNLFTFSLKPGPPSEPGIVSITATPGDKASPAISPDAKQAFYLQQGRIRVAPLAPPAPSKELAVTAALDIDFHKEKREVFRQAWLYQRDNFFDEKFNGSDWDQLRRQFEPYVASARTPEELYRLMNLMVGELNASHLGASPPVAEGKPAAATIGITLDTAALESKGQFLIREVIPNSPAAIAGLNKGELLTAMDNVALTATASLDQLLEYKTGKRIEFTVTAAGASAARTVAIRPIALEDEKTLRYRAWVESRRAYVDKASGGKLGYVHILNMSEESLNQLHLDLDADNHSKQGVVIDIRNNSGGFVNAYALDIFTRRAYLSMLERGRKPISARPWLGQRALELPTILVTNQHSLSDAEDFSEGYRRLQLGKIVGEPTAGWIVYTWTEKLLDGSQWRLPRTKVFDNDGALMEMHPRPVDIPIQRPMGESYSDRDIQLDTAVRELSGHLGEAPTSGR